MTVEMPSAVLRCSRCHEQVEVLGALSLARDPFVCVRCLEPRHAEQAVADVSGGPSLSLAPTDRLAL